MFQGSPIRRNPTHGTPSHHENHTRKSQITNASYLDQPLNPIIVCVLRATLEGLCWRYAKQVESVRKPDSRYELCAIQTHPLGLTPVR